MCGGIKSQFDGKMCLFSLESEKYRKIGQIPMEMNEKDELMLKWADLHTTIVDRITGINSARQLFERSSL